VSILKEIMIEAAGRRLVIKTKYRTGDRIKALTGKDPYKLMLDWGAGHIEANDIMRVMEAALETNGYEASDALMDELVERHGQIGCIQFAKDILLRVNLGDAGAQNAIRKRAKKKTARKKASKKKASRRK
jgi:hypothetical protein